MPFHYDPHDVSRVWFRHPDTGRVLEVPWRRAHMVHAPLTETLVKEVRAIAARRPTGGRLGNQVAEDEIIAELGTLVSGVVPKEWRKRVGAARHRYESAVRDHTEVAVAMAVAEAVTQVSQENGLVSPPAVANPDQGQGFSIWAQEWPFNLPAGEPGGD